MIDPSIHQKSVISSHCCAFCLWRIWFVLVWVNLLSIWCVKSASHYSNNAQNNSFCSQPSPTKPKRRKSTKVSRNSKDLIGSSYTVGVHFYRSFRTAPATPSEGSERNLNEFWPPDKLIWSKAELTKESCKPSCFYFFIWMVYGIPFHI